MSYWATISLRIPYPLGLVPRLPWWLSRKESTCNAADASSVPAAERSPREGNGNPLQCSCLGNLMVRGAWRATVHRVVKSGTRLCDWRTTNSMVPSIHWVPGINPWNKAYACCQDLNKNISLNGVAAADLGGSYGWQFLPQVSRRTIWVLSVHSWTEAERNKSWTIVGSS